MNRRELLVGGAAVAAAVAAQGVSAAGHDHSHHTHGPAKNRGLVDAAGRCVSAGELCQDHCLELLSQGDTSLAACAQTVGQAIAVCTALRSMAAQNATKLAQMAKLAMDVCKECEDECRKHETKHQECKDCAQACADCYAECKKLSV